MGLQVDGAGLRADGQTLRALLGIHLHKMEGPKQMLWAATLWEQGAPLEQLPCYFDNENTCPKKLTEVQSLRCCRANMARRPVLDVPGQCLEVRHGHVVRDILADVIVGCLTGGHHFGWRQWRGWSPPPPPAPRREGVGGKLLCVVCCCVVFFVMCDVVLDICTTSPG